MVELGFVVRVIDLRLVVMGVGFVVLVVGWVVVVGDELDMVVCVVVVVVSWIYVFVVVVWLDNLCCSGCISGVKVWLGIVLVFKLLLLVDDGKFVLV